MPKKVPDYSKSSIYKLVNKEDFDNENIYIGSTTNFIQRKNQHKTGCNNQNNKHYNLKLYKHIRENGGWDNWVMIQIQPYSCASKKELETEERRFIEQLKAKLNNNIPARTSLEYYYDNRDEILKFYHDNRDEKIEKQKQWYNENRDEELVRMKQYHINNRDKLLEYGNQYYINNKDKIAENKKQYYINNRDEYLENTKKYYINNRDKISENKKQKVICDNCGCEITKYYLATHKRSQKCINFKV